MFTSAVFSWADFALQETFLALAMVGRTRWVGIAAGIQWVAAKHPTRCRTAPTVKNDLVQKANAAEAEKPGSQ